MKGYGFDYSSIECARFKPLLVDMTQVGLTDSNNANFQVTIIHIFDIVQLPLPLLYPPSLHALPLVFINSASSSLLVGVKDVIIKILINDLVKSY